MGEGAQVDYCPINNESIINCNEDPSENIGHETFLSTNNKFT